MWPASESSYESGRCQGHNSTPGRFPFTTAPGRGAVTAHAMLQVATSNWKGSGGAPSYGGAHRNRKHVRFFGVATEKEERVSDVGLERTVHARGGEKRKG